jgi:hypothetical protein
MFNSFSALTKILILSFDQDFDDVDWLTRIADESDIP